ncbi:MAG: sodium ion-translocating decarboxylase subunit beta, partial [Clostridia bacterium]|nr:sodium ion-translocating decarboxylase subunit beta [Clostridia bacterium]
MNIFQVFWDFIVNSGFAHLFDIRITENGIENGEIIMIAVSCVLIYLAIGKGFEPLLLLPISFGMLLANLPLSGLMNPEFFSDPKGNLDIAEILSHGGLFDILYLGVKCGVYPPLIFLGVGAMTDFGPLIANPKSILLGAAAQLGIFFTFIASLFLGFNA